MQTAAVEALLDVKATFDASMPSVAAILVQAATKMDVRGATVQTARGSLRQYGLATADEIDHLSTAELMNVIKDRLAERGWGPGGDSAP